MIDIGGLTHTIEQQRKLILERIKRLRREDPFSNNDRSLIVEPGTDAGILFGHEQVVVLENRLKGDLKEIEMALKKIKKGTYGICEKCGKQIDVKRMEAKPSAILCLSCESKLESKKR